MRIVCFSDTHGMHRDIEIPDGDILIFAGDMCDLDESSDKLNFDRLIDFNAFLGELPHRHKVVVCGNHDWAFEKDPALAQSLMTNCIYLQDSGCEIEGLNFWGSPWQPYYGGWAFNLPRGDQLRNKWKKIPKNTDILVTHSPPKGIGDFIKPGRHEGCEDLLHAVLRIKPMLHVFGHIHEDYGMNENADTTFVNASICNFDYEPINKAIVIEI